MSVKISSYDSFSQPRQIVNVWLVAPGGGGSWRDVDIVEGIVSFRDSGSNGLDLECWVPWEGRNGLGGGVCEWDVCTDQGHQASPAPRRSVKAEGSVSWEAGGFGCVLQLRLLNQGYVDIVPLEEIFQLHLLVRNAVRIPLEHIEGSI